MRVCESFTSDASSMRAIHGPDFAKDARFQNTIVFGLEVVFHSSLSTPLKISQCYN